MSRTFGLAAAAIVLSQYVKSSYKYFDAGFTFGKGYIITPRFLLDLRSFIGIDNVDRLIEPNTRLRNVSAQLTLHHKFR